MAKVFKKKITERSILEDIKNNLEEKLLAVYESQDEMAFSDFVTSLTEEQIEILGLNEMQTRDQMIRGGTKSGPEMGGGGSGIFGGGVSNPLSNAYRPTTNQGPRGLNARINQRVKQAETNRQNQPTNVPSLKKPPEPSDVFKSTELPAATPKTTSTTSSTSTAPNLGSYRPGGNPPSNTPAVRGLKASDVVKGLGVAASGTGLVYAASQKNKEAEGLMPSKQNTSDLPQPKLGNELKAQLTANRPASTSNRPTDSQTSSAYMGGPRITGSDTTRSQVSRLVSTYDTNPKTNPAATFGNPEKWAKQAQSMDTISPGSPKFTPPAAAPPAPETSTAPPETSGEAKSSGGGSTSGGGSYRSPSSLTRSAPSAVADSSLASGHLASAHGGMFAPGGSMSSSRLREERQRNFGKVVNKIMEGSK